MEHFGYLADGVHWGSSFGFLFLFYDKWGWDASIGRRGVCIGSGWGFVGGWLLGCRNSAKTVFQKSELASCSRSDSGLLKNNADSRRPRISSPPAEAEPDSIPFRGWCFQREKMSFDDRLWVVSAALDDCKG